MIPVRLSQAISESIADLSGDSKDTAGEINSLSELILNLMQTGFEGYQGLQKKWMEGIRDGSPLPPELDFSKAPLVWLENLQKLVYPFVDFPKMDGSSSDHTNKLIGKYTAFSAKMGELLYQLYLPIDKASRSMLKQMEGTSREGGVSGNSEEAGAWITALETSYMDLLQSPKYTELLHETVDAYKEYCLTRPKLYSLKSSMSQSHDQDKEVDVSQEISQLKERLEELLKRVDSQAQGPNQPPAE